MDDADNRMEPDGKGLFIIRNGSLLPGPALLHNFG
jgi:hypothetical protein